MVVVLISTCPHSGIADGGGVMLKVMAMVALFLGAKLMPSKWHCRWRWCSAEVHGHGGHVFRGEGDALVLAEQTGVVLCRSSWRW